MTILGIDTSTDLFCLGIFDSGKAYEYTLRTGKMLSRLISVSIKRCLDALCLKAGEIDYFACGVGPGSFTGLRIGVSTIKGLSWTQNKPVVGISSLDLLASNVREEEAYIVPVIDAKRGLFYASCFQRSKAGLKRVKPYMLLDKKSLLKYIKPGSVLLGDGVNICQDDIRARINRVTILEKDYWYPQPSKLIDLALARIKRKELTDCFSVKPIYLYPKECQITHAHK